MFFKLVQSRPVRTRDAMIYLIRAMTICGLRAPENYRKLYWLWTVIVFIFCVIYFPLSFILSLTSSDLPIAELIATSQFAINGWSFSFKLVILFLFTNRLIGALTCLDKLDERCKTEHEKESIRKNVTFNNNMYVNYSMMCLLYLISNSARVFFTNRAPFNLYNPILDAQSSREKLYIESAFEFFFIGICTFGNQVVDYYPIIYIISLRTHVRLLVGRITNLCTDEKRTSDQRYQDLIDCITDHKIMLKFCNKIRPIISATIFVQYLACGSILGLAIIYLMVFADFLTGIGTVIYIFAVIMQTFPLCYLCNCLIEDRHDLANATFHSNWFNQDKTYKKVLIYFLQKIQKPMMFSALGVFHITIGTNLTFAKFALTVYTLANKSNFIKKL